MQHVKRIFCIVIGMFSFLFGLAGAFFYGIAAGDLKGRLIGITVGLAIALAGLWLIRRVEKDLGQFIERLIDAIVINWLAH